MENFIQNYAIHLDNLRIEYKITQEKLCEGITTTRNYRRYLTGERIIPHEKIVQFCERLGISVNDFFYSFNTIFQEEFQKVYDLYNNIRNNDYEKFNRLLPKINEGRFFNVQNRKFLNFCIEMASYQNKKSHPKNTLENVSEIIDYPSCLSRDAYDFVDIISLNLIAMIETQFNKTDALNRLIDILTNKKLRYLSSDTRHIMPSIYGNVSLFLARLNRLEECKSVSDSGIKYSLLYSNISDLTRLRYIKAIALLKLGFREAAEAEAIRCISTAISSEDKVQFESFIKILQNDLKVDPLSLVAKYRDKLFEIEDEEK